MHLLKFDLEAKTLTEIPPGEFAAEPGCRYFYVQGKHASVPISTPDGIGEIVWQHPDYQPPSPANATSETHRVTPEQWAQQKRSTERYDLDSACITDLHHRVQTLEAAQQLHTFTADEVAPIVVPLAKSPAAAQPAESLIDRVAEAIYDAPDNHEGWRSEARAAILEVAAWMVEQAPEPGPVGEWLGQISTPFAVMADMLRDEANR